ncbi:MAG TPA: UDP-N-acetylmuramate dehydrogenase [Clostridiaceae bacterium]|nr:UDP-N-acetylmuramate dehydrogenase [Clostridiaceae bacterium]
MSSTGEQPNDWAAPISRSWQLDDLGHYATNLAPQIREQESMALHTTFKIGGPADLFYEPETEDDLIQILKACRHRKIPVTLIGRGSNLVVSDRGIRGMVVALGDKFADVTVYRPNELQRSSWHDILGAENIRGDVYYLYIEAGMPIAELSHDCGQKGLAGLSFACGIPGTVGGAVFMNAGAYGASIEDVVIATRFLDEELNIRTCIGQEHKFGYRYSIFREKNYFIVGTLLLMQHWQRDLIQKEIDDYTNRREKTQPLDEPSGGSVFKRPVGHYTGKLITEAGLKGYGIGGAVVSEKHAGFIVNRHHAKAMDVVNLVHYIQQTIKKRNGVELETELRFVGDYLPEELALVGH